MSSSMEERNAVSSAPFHQSISPSDSEVPNNSRVDITELGSDYLGAQLKDKKQGILRIGFANINSLSPRKDTAKYDSIRSSLAASELDIIGLAETNKCWHLMDAQDTWKEVSKTWWRDSHVSTSYNSRDISESIYQPGGTTTTVINEYAHRVGGSGIDESMLGRWSWVTLRGKQGIKTTFITMYRPCKSTATENTTYAQHLRYLNLCQQEECPRDAILKDIGDFIKSLQEQGHQIVLMADMNVHVSNTNIRQWLQSLDLYEYITERYRNHIATYNNGRHPIDGIFVSHSVQISDGGYLPYGYIHSDHRMIWVDVVVSSVLGFKLPELISPKARRLQVNDPRVLKRWREAYTKYIKDHNLHAKVFCLETEMSQPLSEEQFQCLNAIMKERATAIKYADNKCRKLRVGGVPFSPQLQKQKTTIEVWEAVTKKKCGRTYSTNKIRRLAKKANIHNPMHKSLDEARQLTKEAYKEYYQIKKKAHKLRGTFLDRKAEAIAEEKDMKKATIIKQMKHREQQRISSRAIRHTLKKVRGGAVMKVEINVNGQLKELTTKQEIEQACIDEHEKNFSQTFNTPPMQPPLRELLGQFADTPFCNDILNGTAIFPPDLDEYTMSFLKQLENPHQLRSTKHLWLYGRRIGLKDGQK